MKKCQPRMKEIGLMKKLTKDLTGQQFGLLTVIGRVGNDKQGNALWRCRCDCGNETIIRGYLLRAGNARSCGCLKNGSRCCMPVRCIEIGIVFRSVAEAENALGLKQSAISQALRRKHKSGGYSWQLV